MARKKKSFLDSCKSERCNCNAGSGCGWFLGFLGALVYYWSTTSGFWGTIVGILKAIVWPAMLVHGLFKFLGL